MTISILLIDDNVVFRSGIRGFLESFNDFRLIGEAGNGMDALSLVEQLLPDVIVLDWVMPGMNGLEVLRQLRQKQIKTHVVILSMYAYEDYVTEALQNGAHGYVIKDEVVAHLAEAIRSVATGKLFISPSLNYRDSGE